MSGSFCGTHLINFSRVRIAKSEYVHVWGAQKKYFSIQRVGTDIAMFLPPERSNENKWRKKNVGSKHFHCEGMRFVRHMSKIII